MKSLGYSQGVQDHLLRGYPAPVTDAALRVAVHSADPAPEGDQSAFELPGVPRAAIDRRPGSWSHDGVLYSNAVPVKFGQASPAEGKRVARYWSLGDSSGRVLISGKLRQEQEVVAGVFLEFKPGTLRSEEI